MSTLYELTENYQRLLEMAMDPDTDPEALADTMDALEGEIEAKADGYAMAMKEVRINIDGIKAEVARLTARYKAMERNYDQMKDRLTQSMIVTGKTKFKTKLFSFNIQKTAPAVVIDNPTKLPLKYMIPQEPKIDKAQLKEDLKEGIIPLEGIAHLEAGQSLRIR